MGNYNVYFRLFLISSAGILNPTIEHVYPLTKEVM